MCITPYPNFVDFPPITIAISTMCTTFCSNLVDVFLPSPLPRDERAHVLCCIPLTHIERLFGGTTREVSLQFPHPLPISHTPRADFPQVRYVVFRELFLKDPRVPVPNIHRSMSITMSGSFFRSLAMSTMCITPYHNLVDFCSHHHCLDGRTQVRCCNPRAQT